MEKLWTITDEEYETMVTREEYDKLQKKIDDTTEIVMEMAGRSKDKCIRCHSKGVKRRRYCGKCKFINICGYGNKKYEPPRMHLNEGGHM